MARKDFQGKPKQRWAGFYNRQGGRAGVKGAFSGIKVKRSLYDSVLERDLLFFLEFEPMVTQYQIHPFTLSAADESGSWYTHTPSFLITISNLTQPKYVLVDCLYHVSLTKERTQRIQRIGEIWAESQGYSYGVITEHDLRNGLRLGNLKKLWRYSHVRIPSEIQANYKRRLALYPQGLSILDLVQGVSEYPDPPSPTPTQTTYTQGPHMRTQFIYALIFRRAIETDLQLPLNMNSLVWLPSARTGIYIPKHAQPSLRLDEGGHLCLV